MLAPDFTTIDQVKSTVIDLAVKFGPKLVAAVLVMAVGVVLTRWAAQWLARGLEHVEMEPPVRQLLVRIVRLLLLAVFVVMALQNIGVELLPLLAGVGVAGAGVALAMQGVLGNVVAGLTIIFARPFKVGEYISIVNEEGLVATVSLFSTTLTHFDRSRVVIPNRKIVGEILHNYGSLRQLDIVVQVSYRTDMSRALAVIDDVLRQNPKVLTDPEPAVRTLELGDSAVRIGVMPWVSALDYQIVTGEVNRALLESFRVEDIDIPLPQREVRLLPPEGEE